jgi:hypothetical protein
MVTSCPYPLCCRLVQQQAADLAQQRSTLQQLSADKAAALAAAERQAAAALQGAEREHRLAMQEAQQAWERQKAALEQQRVEAVLQVWCGACVVRARSDLACCYPGMLECQPCSSGVKSALATCVVASDCAAAAHGCFKGFVVLWRRLTVPSIYCVFA